ncbi:TetR/AcrR family transcriptional regulator [Aliikangiella coralliicola]|uniref:TetR family transcriptional regulator n=1 Tax=Aliikangiella coralliicola TaxID=2592383 RepID=A0A545U7C4_9GAMM|nr:TetR/AcrR family transcriptional regulator [Aliikangiella coralliicola]TQV85367.1 TetR family transcriptional regulator [Aliikangiella coralliicola]
MGRIGHCRQHILDAGLAVLSQKGYNGTGVKEIVGAAGVPKGSFYNHFESKEAFVIEAMEKLADESSTRSEIILNDQTNSPKQRLLNLFDENHQQLKSSEFCGGCLIGNLCLEMSDENPAIRDTANRIMDDYVNSIAECLTQAREAGELHTSTNVKELAEFIHCAWEGTLMRMKASKACEPFNIFRSQLESFFL